MYDGFEQQEDVEDLYVSKLRKMALIDKDLERPPMVVLVWGKEVFKGVLTKVDAALSMFNADGIATRANVQLAFQETTEAISKAQKEERDQNKAPPGDAAAGATPFG